VQKEGRTQRRLAAIVAADVAGYSRLVGDDEEGTLSALRAHRNELFDPLLEEHGGRVANTAGDSLLLEFSSAVDAVRCAVAVQEGMTARNESIDSEKQIWFRIGINVGDVVAEAEDLLGDGVNVAARLEGLAEPGGICISRMVRDSVRDRMNLELLDMDEIEVKNIARPVRVFRVLGEGEGASAPAKPAKGSWQKYVAAAAIIVVIIAGGGFWWWQQPGLERADKSPLPLPDKPSIAVLPFDNLSDNPEQEYFADGMAEDIITDLSKISGLFVIARNSTFSYKGQTIDIKTVGQELGVAYLLEGSVQRAGDQVRINVQLIDSQSGGHLWAERYDGKLADVFALQDRITGAIVQALSVTLTGGEKAQSLHIPTNNPRAYDLFLKARAAYFRFDADSLNQSLQYYEEATDEDPIFVDAYAGIARTAYQLFASGFGRPDRSTSAALERAQSAVERTLEMDPDNGLALTVQAAIVQITTGDHEKTIALAKQATAALSGTFDGRFLVAYLYARADQPEAARREIETALRRSPRPDPGEAYIAGLVLSYGGDYARGIEYLESARDGLPAPGWARLNLAAAYAETGRMADAKVELNSYLSSEGFGGENEQGLSIKLQHFAAGVRERLLAALRLAGLPEWPHGFEGKTENRLSANAIAKIIFGATRFGTQGGTTYEVDIGENGEAHYRDENEFSMRGIFWIDEDSLCYKYPDFNFGRTHCGAVFHNPDGNYKDRSEYVFVHPANLAWFSIKR